MVRRLIQQEQVGRTYQEFSEQYPAFLSSGKHPYFFQSLISIEHHKAADCTRNFPVVFGQLIEYFTLNGLVGVEAVDIGLSEVGKLQFRMAGNCPFRKR